uniref:G_PROTEIN_RECEP_F1_2 domain-containing protein n=1 Tax=Parastrongyloides trichosuri TaxID=131310 RepID=A0A0N5A3S6_PARTI
MADCQFLGLPFLEFKFIFVGIIGTIIAIISAVENLLLFITFMISKKLKQRDLTYLTTLSVLDICVAVSYIDIMSIQIYAEYFKNYPLFVFWHNWLKESFTVSNITLSSGSFILIAATFERYLQTKSNSQWKYFLKRMHKYKKLIVCLCIFLGILFRGTIYFEIDIRHDKKCIGFSGWSVALSNLSQNEIYSVYWRFWIRRIATIFGPFFILTFCNLSIIYHLRKHFEEENLKKMLTVDYTSSQSIDLLSHRLRIRAMTRSLIMVVSCYLWANIIDVVVAFWEYINVESLKSLPGFYTVASDISSVLPVLASAVRLIIYSINDVVIKNEVRKTLKKIISIFFPCLKINIENESLNINNSFLNNSFTANIKNNLVAVCVGNENAHNIISPVEKKSNSKNEEIIKNEEIDIIELIHQNKKFERKRLI